MKLFELRAQLTNPFVTDYFKNLGSIWGSIGQSWAWELEHCFYPRALVDIDISVKVKEDHQGVDFTAGVLGYGIHFHIYDTRHYNGSTI
jgi:hypothetical protein